MDSHCVDVTGYDGLVFAAAAIGLRVLVAGLNQLAGRFAWARAASKVLFGERAAKKTADDAA